MAFYVDINPVRAGLVTDPKDCRFCGYGEDVAGDVAAARAGFCQVHGAKWINAHAAHRIGLSGTGEAPRPAPESLRVDGCIFPGGIPCGAGGCGAVTAHCSGNWCTDTAYSVATIWLKVALGRRAAAAFASSGW